MKRYAFDIETFPNFWSCTYLDIDDPDMISCFSICIDAGINELEKMKEFLDSGISMLVGYNNLSYDSPILEFVYNYSGTNINADVYDLSQKIISRERGEMYSSQKNYLWPQMDLMKIMAFDKLGISLKQCAINLNWKKIQDLPLPYNHTVQKDEIEKILKYNINDVLITFELYKSLLDKIELRESLSKLYEVNLLNASDSKMANILLEKFYTEQSGLELSDIKYLRTRREFLWLKECISPRIYFKTKKLNELKSEISQTLVVAENNFAYKKKLSFGGNNYELGVGGLHSDDDPMRFIADDSTIIRDCDVASYYPNIIITNNIIPSHLDNNFLEILKKITEERIEAKKNGDKVKADGLKITINSIFGKLGSETFWLQDPKAFLSVTVSGQLFLLMLVESLVLEGIEVISANTDGIVSRIPKNLEDKYYEVCNRWQQETLFELEYTDYSLYVRSDVNNYLTKKTDGKTKEKGRYLEEIDLKRGYRYPIVPKCLFEYFVNNKTVRAVLEDSKNILDFCISQKTGRDFVLEYRKDDGSKEALQKTNRFYISNSGGKLVKVRQTDNYEIGLYVGNYARIINDLDSRPTMDFYDLNYDFYEDEVYKYIDPIIQSSEKKYWEEEDLGSPEEIEEEEFDVSKIKIMSPKFGHSKSNYVFEKESMSIYRGLNSIKYITPKPANELFKISKRKYSSFVDFLTYVENNTSVNSRQIEILININYFDCFGKNKKLHNIYKEFKEGKNKYVKTHKQETQNKRIQILTEFEKNQKDESLSILDQINIEMNLLGNITTLYPHIDKRYVYVKSISKKFSPKIEAYSLTTGKVMPMKVQKGIYSLHSFDKGDILYCKSFERKSPARFVDGEFIENTKAEKEWWLMSYILPTKESLDKLLEEN